MKEWKDRGWWMSVEINRKHSARKNEDRALALLDASRERYELRFENGETVTRGIFTLGADLLSLARLLELTNRWTGTVVYANGNQLGTGDVNQVAKLLKCAANWAGCRSGGMEQRLAYLGCHLAQIGLMNYSLASLKRGNRYWFSYLKSETGAKPPITLDKHALAKTMENSLLCPLFPSLTTAIIEKLPPTVSLRPDNHRLFWVAARQKIRSRWLSRFPPVVPYSEEMYRSWIRLIMKALNF